MPSKAEGVLEVTSSGAARGPAGQALVDQHAQRLLPLPDGVTVEAVDHLGPQLSARDTVLLWDGDGSSPLFPPWVVADVAKREFTFATRAQQVRRVALLERSGYQVVFKRRGYIVLHRTGGRPGARAAQAASG